MVEEGGLEPAQAHAILAATLMALDTQERRMELEEEAAALLKKGDG